MFDGHDDEGSSDPGESPESDLVPEVDDPSEDLGPDVPTVRDYSEVDADPELKKEFWAQVLLFNVALLGISAGLMFIGFERRLRIGGGLLVIGAFALARGLQRYRAVQNGLLEDE